MATIYKVKTVPCDSEDGQNVVHVVWAPSEGAAKKARRELAEKYGLKPLKDVNYEVVSMPTSKVGAIEWLNENCKTEPAH